METAVIEILFNEHNGHVRHRKQSMKSQATADPPSQNNPWMVGLADKSHHAHNVQISRGSSLTGLEWMRKHGCEYVMEVGS